MLHSLHCRSANTTKACPALNPHVRALRFPAHPARLPRPHPLPDPPGGGLPHRGAPHQRGGAGHGRGLLRDAGAAKIILTVFAVPYLYCPAHTRPANLHRPINKCKFLRGCDIEPSYDLYCQRAQSVHPESLSVSPRKGWKKERCLTERKEFLSRKFKMRYKICALTGMRGHTIC